MSDGEIPSRLETGGTGEFSPNTNVTVSGWVPAALLVKEIDMHGKHSVVRHSYAGSVVAVLSRALTCQCAL